jgi:hypothetical protein
MVPEDDNNYTKYDNNEANNECVDDDKTLWEDYRDPKFQSAYTLASKRAAVRSVGFIGMKPTARKLSIPLTNLRRWKKKHCQDHGDVG